jgi:hypothetical protein
MLFDSHVYQCPAEVHQRQLEDKGTSTTRETQRYTNGLAGLEHQYVDTSWRLHVTTFIVFFISKNVFIRDRHFLRTTAESSPTTTANPSEKQMKP